MPNSIATLLRKALRAPRFKRMGLKTDYPQFVHPSIATEPTVVFLGSVSVGEDVKIGRNTYVADGRISPNVEIGRYCSISRNVNIGGTEHPVSWLTSSPIAYSSEYFPSFRDATKFDAGDTRETKVGNDVWIGASVTVKRGVTIGDGAVIGAGSVVTQDIPPYAIAVGVPARVMKYRFSEVLIDRLLRLKWWELDESKLQNIAWNDVAKSISQLEDVL